MDGASYTLQQPRIRAANHSTTVLLLAMNAVIGMMSVVYGLDFAVPALWRGTAYHAASIIAVAGLIGLLLTTCRIKTWTGASKLPSWLAPVLCLDQVALSLFFNLPTWAAIPSILIFVLGMVLLGLRFSPGAATSWAVAWGVLLWIGTVLAFPINLPRADMLPVIEHAIDVFRIGGSPYAADYSAITENPFFYPPVQWLVFLPPRVLGIDIRIVSLMSAAMMVALVEWFGRASGSKLHAGAYPIMLSPLALPMMHSGQVWPYWLAILCMALFMLRSSLAWVALVAALAVGMRQTALLPAAAIFAAMAGRTSGTTLLRAALVGVATLAAIVAPFATSWRMMLVDGPHLALMQAQLQGNPANQIAVSNLLDWVGLARWSTCVEAALGLLTIVLARRVVRLGTRPMLAVAGIGYALTVSANPYLHRYYYVAGLLLAGIALAASQDPAHRRFQTSVAETA